MKKNGLIIFILLIFTSLFLVFLTQKNAIENTQKIKVTASFYPLYDFAKNVGGDKTEVINITPAGSEPHDFDPTPQDIVNIQKSKLFIYNDINLERWTDKLLPDLGSHIIKASNGINITSSDPHVWLDPVLAQIEVKNITQALKAADHQNQSIYDANSQNYINKLKTLDTEFKVGLSSCTSRDFITSHQAFGYLASRYNLNMISIAGFSPDAEPSPQTLANLANFGKNHNVKYIFFESLVSPKLSQTLAQELGAKTLVLDPIEGLTADRIKSGENYISLQRQNLANLRLALNCK
ncbi:zinc ABC transporter substrate-binding protein [Candidatus Woesebacteria bacterium]|nr:zinc ABC transporter substrate-binding protein [Candidatus Woesebacteria bacterium]QQG47897.1 MAG: zinc ABC transporter substrate-binding protein [Candidatus Woesebacteria bacterium]